MKVIQISDIHLHKNPKYKIFSLVNPEENFIDVLNLVIRESPDIVIASGDLSQDGSIESYQRLKNYLKNINCDIYVINGNHDNHENLQNHLIADNIKCTPFLKTNYGTFIFCNSLVSGEDSGFINMPHLFEIERYLNRFESCILVIHHHFFPLNIFSDKFILNNWQQFLNTLLKYKHKIKFCMTGHVHNNYNVIHNGLKIHTGLSTCIQFAKTKDLLFDFKKPGYTVYLFDKNNYEISEKHI